MSICGKLHRNPRKPKKEIASGEIGVNGRKTDGRPDGQLENKIHPLPVVGGSVIKSHRHLHCMGYFITQTDKR